MSGQDWVRKQLPTKPQEDSAHGQNAEARNWAKAFALLQLLVVLLTVAGMTFRFAIPVLWLVGALGFFWNRRRASLIGNWKVWSWLTGAFVLLGAQYCLYAYDPKLIILDHRLYPLTPILLTLAAAAWVRGLILSTAPLLSDPVTRRPTKRVCGASALAAAWIGLSDVNIDRFEGRSVVRTVGMFAVVLSCLVALSGLVELATAVHRTSDVALLAMFPAFAAATLLAVTNRQELWMLSAFAAVSMSLFASTHSSAASVGRSLNHRTVVTEVKFARVFFVAFPGLVGISVVALHPSTVIRVLFTLSAVICQIISLRAFERRLVLRRHAAVEKALGQMRSGLVDHYLHTRYRSIIRLHDGARAGLEVGMFDGQTNMFEPLLAQALLDEDRALVVEATMRLVEDAASHLTATLLLLDVDEPFMLIRISGDLLADDRFCIELQRRLLEIDLTGMLLVADFTRVESRDAIEVNLKQMQDRGAWAGLITTSARTSESASSNTIAASFRDPREQEFDYDFLLVPRGDSGDYGRVSRTLAIDLDSPFDVEFARSAGIEFGVGAAVGQYAPIGSLISPTRIDVLSELLRVVPET